MTKERTILHIDMDAFFAAVEQSSHPHLKGKPLIVSSRSRKRGVVASSSYEARSYGIKSGMSVSEACRHYPGLRIIESDFSKYEYTAEEIFRLLLHFSPQVEIFSIDEAFIDLSGKNSTEPIVLAKEIKRKIGQRFGLTCSIGIGPNKLLAKLASSLNKPDGLRWIRKEEIPQILEKLPVEKLCGIGEKTKERLANLGVVTAAHLGRIPINILLKEFGQIGLDFHQMGLGEDYSPVMPFYAAAQEKSMSHGYTLPQDTADQNIIKAVLLWLSEKVGRRLRKEKLQGKTIYLTVRLANFSTFRRFKTLKDYIDEGEQIYRNTLYILKSLNLDDKPIRLLGVGISNLIPKKIQLSLFLNERRKENLKEILDKINNRYGEDTVFRVSLLPYKRHKIFNPLIACKSLPR